MAVVADLVAAMETLAPLAGAEPWDNVGLLVGAPEQPLQGVLLTIDATPRVIDEAVRLGCSALVAYHPPVFEALKRVRPVDPAYALVRAGLAVYSPHTALDVARGGTNDVLAEALALAEPSVLRPTQVSGLGLGRIGTLASPMTLEHLAEHVKRALAVPHVLVVEPQRPTRAGGSLGAELRRVAVGAGAGGSLLEAAALAGADALVCGELSHHDALKAARLGLAAVTVLHGNSERIALPPLAKRLGERLGAAVPVHVSVEDRDPLRVL